MLRIIPLPQSLADLHINRNVICTLLGIIIILQTDGTTMVLMRIKLHLSIADPSSLRQEVVGRAHPQQVYLEMHGRGAALSMPKGKRGVHGVS